MNGQNIPGFYWDAEKKKYFRIQTSGAAQRKDWKYTTSNLRKEDRKQKQKKIALALTDKTHKERVVRRHARSFAFTDLDREIGLRRQSAYMQELWPNACVSGLQVELYVGLALGLTCRYFHRDPATQTIYAVHNDNQVVRLRSDDRGQQIWDELTRTTSQASSLCYMPASGAIAVTTCGGDRPPVVYLSDPDIDGPYVGQQFTPKGCNTIWGASARPTSFDPTQGLTNSVAATSQEHLAVAASSSMLLFSRSQSGTWDSESVVQNLGSDILSLDWISYTTVAFGCRNGKVHLHDTRSGGSSHVLTHPTPICKIKRADDETRLVCSGLQDTLLLYDLRSPRRVQNHNEDTTSQRQHESNRGAPQKSNKRRKIKANTNKVYSQPVLKFVHHNQDDINLTIDIHPRLGLLAASQDDSTKIAIRISNLYTGELVKELKTQPYMRQLQEHKSIRSLQFQDHEDSRHGVELLSAWGNSNIVRFSWHDVL